MAASNPGDTILDPFFGTGTTGRWRDGWPPLHRPGARPRYPHREKRIAEIQPLAPKTFLPKPSKRSEPRIPFGVLIERACTPRQRC